MTRAYIAKGIYGCLAYLEVDDMANIATYSEAPYTPWGTDPSAKRVSRKVLRQMVKDLKGRGYTVRERTGQTARMDHGRHGGKESRWI